MTRWSFQGGCHFGLGIEDNFFWETRDVGIFPVDDAPSNPTGSIALFCLYNKIHSKIHLNVILNACYWYAWLALYLRKKCQRRVAGWLDRSISSHSIFIADKSSIFIMVHICNPLLGQLSSLLLNYCDDGSILIFSFHCFTYFLSARKANNIITGLLNKYPRYSYGQSTMSTAN